MTVRDQAAHNIYDAIWALEDAHGDGYGLEEVGRVTLELPITDDRATRKKVREALQNLMDAYMR